MGLMRPITRKDTVLKRQNLLYSRICLLSSRLPAYLSALLALPANHCRRRKLRERETLTCLLVAVVWAAGLWFPILAPTQLI
jgi:hypothetical protein